MDLYWGIVSNFLTQIVKNESDVEDIVIQTFSKAFEKIHTYSYEYNFSTWLLTISKNIYIDQLRRNKTKNNFFVDDSKIGDHFFADNQTVEDEIIKKQNVDELLENIKKLKPHYRKIIYLRYFDGLSYKEISEKNNESISNVKIKLLRAKKLLFDGISKTINSEQTE